jgi:cobalt-zinc-cadmium efflux system outer membrane protein
MTHPTLRPGRLDPDHGLTPGQAAILAVLMNPKLRADLDRRGLANAQLLQAGFCQIRHCPLLRICHRRHHRPHGNRLRSFAELGIHFADSASAKTKAAQQNSASVYLDVAWNEWQTAQAARIAVYRIIALQEEFQTAKKIEQSEEQDADLLRQAVASNSKTELYLATAESSSFDELGFRLLSF